MTGRKAEKPGSSKTIGRRAEQTGRIETPSMTGTMVGMIAKAVVARARSEMA
jgi:hypothetical protein